MYAKLVEVQQQVLHLTKVVQKLVPAPGGSRDLGSHTLPEGVILLLGPQCLQQFRTKIKQNMTTFHRSTTKKQN